ncbi:flagellar export protein FliJ [Candidatus Methylospira mobilis]|nr:flagellar export protein FliJ [Candidatus Methylospira mobilis]WNV06827.1 flagellar export protein FliJ [Candidatus Methylospira mobilis]
MVENSSLATLVELAAREAEQTAVRMSDAIREKEVAANKLAVLEQYREEYRDICAARMVEGLSILEYSNFQAFMANMDRTIAGQQQIVEKIQERVDNARGVWQAAERKRLSFDVLQAQEEKKRLHRENRLDQKLMDEYASLTKQHRKNSR